MVHTLQKSVKGKKGKLWEPAPKCHRVTHRAGHQKVTMECLLNLQSLFYLCYPETPVSLHSPQGETDVRSPRRYDVAGVGGGEFALRLVPRQRAAPHYWRSSSHTHTHSNNCRHSSSTSAVKPLVLKTPPAVHPKSIASYLWEPFNWPEHSLCFGKNDNNFNKDNTMRMVVSAPKRAESDSIPHVAIQYNLHCADKDATILPGSGVLSISGLYSPFEACPNRNLFQHFFRIEFPFDGHTYVCAISTFEFARCFNLIEPIQYHLSHEKYCFGLDASMPAHTSAWVFKQVHSHIVFLRDLSCKVFLPNQFAAPAATIQTLVNGTICTCL